jgi:hypothetical protein
MPQFNSTCLFQDFLFSPEEIQHAKHIGPLTLAYIHSFRARVAANHVALIQQESESDTMFLRRIAESRAQLEILTELIDDLTAKSSEDSDEAEQPDPL